MTSLVAHAPQLRLNWPRVGALSGSMSLHLGILLLLLAPPVAMQALKRIETDTTVVHIITPPEKIEIKEPEPPQPVQKKREARPQPRIEHVLPTQPAVVTESTPMSYPATDDAPPASDNRPTVQDVAPTALAYGNKTRVPYPIEAARRGEHGTVVLRVLVGSDGLPQQVEVEKSSGSSRLDSAARDAVLHWTFQAGTRNGVAQSAWARVPIAFDLTQL